MFFGWKVNSAFPIIDNRKDSTRLENTVRVQPLSINKLNFTHDMNSALHLFKGEITVTEFKISVLSPLARIMGIRFDGNGK